MGATADQNWPGPCPAASATRALRQEETAMTRRLIAAALAAIAALLASPVAAQTRADVIPLGRSAASGAVCQAYRDYDDTAVQAPGRRAWTVRCRGWEGVLGRLYAIDKADGPAPWQAALAGRAECHEPKAQPFA